MGRILLLWVHGGYAHTGITVGGAETQKVGGFLHSLGLSF